MLIAIEGIDASGKHTQAALLKEAADRAGVSAEVVSFPRYGQTLFAASVADYLNGRFGDLASVPPQFAALLYAGDRFESRETVRRLIATHDLVICDRYVASNLAYQAARVEAAERDHFLSWIAKVEHEVFGLPSAHLTFFLDVPAETAARMLLGKGARTYTTERADLHERDTSYLARCREVYLALAATDFGSDWHVVPCVLDDGTMRASSDIHDLLWTRVRAALADSGPAEPASAHEAAQTLPGATNASPAHR